MSNEDIKDAKTTTHVYIQPTVRKSQKPTDMTVNAEAHAGDDAPASRASASPAAARAGFIVTLTLYCVSGTLLTLFNKLLIKLFPLPNVAILLQNVATVALLRVGSLSCPSFFGDLPSVDASLVRMWWPLTAMFVGLLVSSMLALMHVSAVTLIVFRNLTSLSVAVLEYAVLGTRVPIEGALALLGIIAGAVMYAAHDLTFSWTGYAWLLANLVSTSAYQVWVKRVISSSEAQTMGPFGFSYVNNLLSLPALAAIALFTGEPLRMAQGAFISSESMAVLFLSCVLGCTLSVSAFMVNIAVSATSMMVANNVNKFFVIILSEIFVQSTLDAVATAGCVTVLLFGFWYARSRQKKSSEGGSDSAAGSIRIQAETDKSERGVQDKGTAKSLNLPMLSESKRKRTTSFVDNGNRV